VTPEQAVWAIALVVLAGLALLSFIHRRVSVPVLRREHLVRSPTHKAQVDSLNWWLRDPKIIRTILDERIATGEGLQRTLEAVEGMDEGEVAATVGLLLQNRNVRRVVAHLAAKADRLPIAAVREALVEWATPVREELH
jgi:hypothetical protein